MDNPLSNVYTDRDFQYLKSKSLDVCIVVRHRGTKEVTMRSSVPHSEAVKMIRGMENTKKDTWVTEAQKNRFPKSPEPLEDILNCKPKIQKLQNIFQNPEFALTLFYKTNFHSGKIVLHLFPIEFLGCFWDGI